MTAAASSDSIATVDVSLPAAETSESSEMQPPIVYRTRRLWTDTTWIDPLGSMSSPRSSVNV